MQSKSDGKVALNGFALEDHEAAVYGARTGLWFLRELPCQPVAVDDQFAEPARGLHRGDGGEPSPWRGGRPTMRIDVDGADTVAIGDHHRPGAGVGRRQADTCACLGVDPRVDAADPPALPPARRPGTRSPLGRRTEW